MEVYRSYTGFPLVLSQTGCHTDTLIHVTCFFVFFCDARCQRDDGALLSGVSTMGMLTAGGALKRSILSEKKKQTFATLFRVVLLFVFSIGRADF